MSDQTPMEGAADSAAPSKARRTRKKAPSGAVETQTPSTPTPTGEGSSNKQRVNATVASDFFRWSDQHGTYTAHKDQEITAAPDVIDRGLSLGTLK